MRHSQPQSIGKITRTICTPKVETGKTSPEKQVKPIFVKQELWNRFCSEFQKLYGKPLIKTKEILGNLEVLFHYFLKDPAFFKCKNLITTLNEPSFDKGLLIIGDVGVGKTDNMKCFENIFQPINSFRFKSYNAKSLVREYEKCASPMDKDYFFKDKDRKQIFIDDIGSENNASNYGLFDVIGNIISDRYDKNQVTYITTNFATSANSVEETLSALGEKYGHRVYDRLFEMFNIVTFTGQSLRK
ncbi:P-loop NTPase family protein [Bizionia myxarmorum]|uniref:Uncharacterized protein n=1 Tax=Bizionia myxarmorum TaxID=291186 RepID=A0A5D0RDV5_9FLAO|nr:hypothetical protein [Bizionia myxarmorum]TYB79166.1 hypothetical protein ES674_05165 [Bizionia myxarmorum]